MQKTAIITGGSRGIGKAIALKLAKDGFNIVINFNSDNSKTAAQEVANEIKSLGQEALIIQANVAQIDSAKKMVEETMEKFGRVDVLVNNAGITKDGLMMRMSEEQFNDVIKINVNGVFNMTQAVIKPMMKQRKGSIINMASVVGVVGNAGQMNYSASKAAVIGMSKTTAKELGSRNIRCNAIAPGFIKTAMTDKLSEKVLDGAKGATQLKTLGSPEDVANLAAFLASDNSSYITGQVINVCGGMVI